MSLFVVSYKEDVRVYAQKQFRQDFSSYFNYLTRVFWLRRLEIFLRDSDLFGSVVIIIF